LKFAADTLKGNCEVVLAAVKQDGLALQFAAEGPRGNKDVVLAAVKHNPAVLPFAVEPLRIDQEVNAAVGGERRHNPLLTSSSSLLGSR